MNTLSKARTGSLPGVASSTDLRAHWRALLQSPRRHTLTATHHLIYQALLGRDWRRGFTPPTNTRKLANGAFAISCVEYPSSQPPGARGARPV